MVEENSKKEKKTEQQSFKTEQKAIEKFFSLCYTIKWL